MTRAFPYVSQATFHGGAAIVDVRSSRVVEHILPHELRPASAPHLPEGTIVILFGDQTEGTLLFGNVPWPVGTRYAEMLLAVPFVRLPGTDQDYTYVLRMFCERFAPAAIGNSVYGLAKRLARMSWEDATFRVFDEAGQHLTRVSMTAEAGSDSAGAVALATVLDALSLPILGKKPNGAYASCDFGWDATAARTQAIRTRMDCPTGLEGLAPGAYHSPPGLSCEVRGLVWRLSWPRPVPR